MSARKKSGSDRYSPKQAKWLGRTKIRLIGLLLVLFFFVTPPVMWIVATPVFANGDHSDEHPHAFNPIAFGLVTGAAVIVGYFMYRIFSGKGKKDVDTEEDR